MREIKFRGMTEAGEWLYGGYVTRNNAHYILDGECDHVEIDGREANILHFHIVKYKTVGEYTGLKDKNGKEIYEGDIVEKWSHCSLLERRSPFYNGGVGYHKSFTTTVKWSEQGLNYNIYPHHDDAYWLVIGNIWENPELLES